MITLPGVAIHSKLYESPASLVYRGIREQDNCAVVAKVLKQDYPSAQELTRYRQEYEITRSLNIEGVIKAYSQRDHQRTLVILLEDFGGESLEYWMRQQSDFCPMPLLIFLDVAIALTDTLGKLHAANVIHKDINPGNIVFNPNTGVVKMIDFGIATRFNRTNPTFKSLHLLEGTVAYLSPEQTGRMNRMLDYRTDFYSLGVTFYELLTGQLPFPTQDVLELVHCHIARPPTPPHELNATIPQPVSDLIVKLMAKNAEDRYQSAWGIKADLEHCAQQLAEIGRIDSIPLCLQDVSEQFCIPQKLYGREAEIAALLATFDRVAAAGEVERGRHGDTESNTILASPRSHASASSEMLLVSGYAGVGKTALVQELYSPITAKHGYFISGKFDQFGRNVPYSAIIDALRKLVQQLLGEPDKQVEWWRSRLLNALGSNGQIIIDVIPEVELIIGQQPSVPEVGATEAQNRFNLTFQKFVRVFCSKNHPLVIFLDDLQWIDSATLKLIELILLDEQTQYLFLIGAYRDNEVTPTHSLVSTLERLRNQGAVLQEIILTPLALEPLSQLLAETLHHSLDTVRSLAQVVSLKTEGNPFFVGEFLKLLYGENLLTFDAQQLNWQWNLAEIEVQGITDNVVELLLRQLQKLSEATQQLLCFAACVGAEFDLETLVIVCEKSRKAIFQDLLAAIQDGLIQPLSDLDENLLVQKYKFSHDRVQQAAYTLIDESRKQTVHLQIGRNLLEKTSLEQQADWLFVIVDHLNQGIELVLDPDERIEIAGLNLRAGQKAKAAIAYSSAKKYLAVGREWLAASSWENYELTLDLHLETTEVAYLCGDFEQVEYWAAIVLPVAKTVFDRVKVYEIKIQTDIAQNQPLKAINTALQVLQQLGISFPEQPSQSDIRLELDAIASLIGSKSIENLRHLPQMTQPDKLAAMRILSGITVTAYIAAPDLLPLLASKQVNLSIQYGHAFASPLAYALCGLILCGMVGNIESGYQFGQLALRQLSQPNADAFKARTLMFVNIFIIHRKEHIREILQPLLEAYHSGLETGDIEFAAYCTHTHSLQSFVVGKELLEIEREMAVFSEAVRQLKQEAVVNWFQISQQFILNLRGCSINPTRLIGEFYNENNLTEHGKDGFAIFLVYFNNLILYFLFSEFEQAVEHSTRAKNYLLQVRATPTVPLYYLYDALARLAVYPRSTGQEQGEVLRKVSLNQEKIKQWAEHAPMNYLHKFYLVEAEKARVLGQFLEAEEFYEQAIAGAGEHEFIQEEALAYELAAKHYLARGREKIAQTYMKEAHYCYNRWGATAKVKDLETRYPQFFSQSPRVSSTSIPTPSKTASNTSPIAFDIAAAMKASQAISREVELEPLLYSLMQLLIQNAGAQAGYLILEDSGEWFVEASYELNDGENGCATQVLRSTPVANHLPESIIQYVIRTQETVTLSNASREGIFINEPYIQRHQTQSVLCLPLLNQGELVGVLYLENQLAAGAFTPERSQILHLLSTQTAIAIENAKLYAQLRASKNELMQFFEAVPVGIGVVDATGRPYYCNQRAIQLLGKGIEPTATPDQFAESYQIYVAGTDQPYPTEKMAIVRALSGDRTMTDDMEIRQNNVAIPVEVWGTPVFDEQGDVAYAIATFQDITKRKQAEKLLADYNYTLEQQVVERTAALQASETELRALFAAIPDPLCVVTAEGRVIEKVEGSPKQLYCSIEDMVGKTLHQIFEKEQADKFLDYIQQALRTQQVLTAEYNLWMAGREIWLSARIAPIQHDRVIWLARDITLQKQAEAASILEERNRMAREIHDTLAQAFTGILIQVGAATQVLTDDSEATQSHLDTIEQLAHTGLTEARRSVKALRPQLLEESDLSSALDRLVSHMRASTDAALIYEIQGIAYPIPSEVENNLLRIGQEALTNAIKYAHAREIRVELVYDDAQCCLHVKDDGQGFGVVGVPTSGGFGLLGMSERAERIGAQLTIGSQPGQGTEIVVIVNRG